MADGKKMGIAKGQRNKEKMFDKQFDELFKKVETTKKFSNGTTTTYMKTVPKFVGATMLSDIIDSYAKGKFRNSGDETFFFNGKSFKFEKNDPTLFFMQRLRDEAHRFAITSHRAKRAKGLSKSLLDQIDGIGAIRKRALLNHFGSARSVESASFDEIKSVEGVEEKVAKKIYNFFHE